MEMREKFVARILNNPHKFGFSRVKMLSAPQVQTAKWTRLRCWYVCDAAGEGPANCPQTPLAEDTEQIVMDYKMGLFVCRQIDPPFPEDLSEQWAEFQESMIFAENESFKRGYGKAFALGVGNCLFGHHDDRFRPCKFPGKRRPTLESIGVNLHETLDLLAWEDLLVRDPEDPFTMFGLLLLE